VPTCKKRDDDLVDHFGLAYDDPSHGLTALIEPFERIGKVRGLTQ
jgi:hypothetical protein